MQTDYILSVLEEISAKISILQRKIEILNAKLDNLNGGDNNGEQQ